MLKQINQLGVFLLCATIRVYQLTLSYFIGNRCRFLPTCSEYAKDVIKTHGVVEGGKLALKRLSRCHPFYRQNSEDSSAK